MLFVCLGNICRSPTAQAVFEHQVASEGLSDVIHVDSAGTGGWHVGESPDQRATTAARQRGYAMAHLRGRQVQAEDLQQFDYVLAMDSQNLRDLIALHRSHHPASPPAASTTPCRFLERYLPESSEQDVPDPYYGGDQGFEHVLDVIEAACHHLLADVKHRLANPEPTL